ncbi:DUF4297 domain-containing protein, partial [Enterococcus faecalis]|nr:DUF4297 domain-containing protein [Enterococcus faecalis]
MSNETIYMELPFDLSGSRSKNRFRYEILWGLSKLFDIYNENESFVMVFDYACDIEVHKESGFDFYQIKTKKDGAVYTQGALLTKKKLENEDKSFSILGRLYSLANNSNKNIHVNLVSNKPFQDSSKKNHTTIENLDFSSLEEGVQTTIESKIQEELNSEVTPDMSKISFIFTSIDLFSPDDTLRGKTSKFFFELTGSEPNKPNALYNLLVETISEKACYELKLNCYSDIVNKKGISKDHIDKIISLYSQKTDRAVEKASMFIDTNVKKPIKRLKLKTMLGKVVSDIESGNTMVLQNEEHVVQSIFSNIDEFDVEENDFIDILISEFSKLFTIEYSEDYRYAFFLLIIMKVEENIYE